METMIVALKSGQQADTGGGSGRMTSARIARYLLVVPEDFCPASAAVPS